MTQPQTFEEEEDARLRISEKVWNKVFIEGVIGEDVIGRCIKCGERKLLFFVSRNLCKECYFKEDKNGYKT